MEITGVENVAAYRAAVTLPVAIVVAMIFTGGEEGFDAFADTRARVKSLSKGRIGIFMKSG